MSELSKRLADAKGDRSIDDIAAVARKAGHKIDRSVIAKYVAGDHGPRPPQKTLAALAAGLGLDVRELRELAGKPRGELGPWVPTSEAASLTQEERDALDQLIKVMTRKGDGRSGEAHGGNVVDLQRPPADTAVTYDVPEGHQPIAARHGRKRNVEADQGFDENQDLGSDDPA